MKSSNELVTLLRDHHDLRLYLLYYRAQEIASLLRELANVRGTLLLYDYGPAAITRACDQSSQSTEQTLLDSLQYRRLLGFFS